MLAYGIRNKLPEIVRKLFTHPLSSHSMSRSRSETSGPYYTMKELVVWERRFKQITPLVGEWIWEIDPRGYFTYCNPVVEQVLGYDAEEMKGRLLYDLFYYEDLTKFRNLIDIFNKERPFKDFTARFMHKEGHWVTIESHGLPILSHNGDLFGYIGISRDITQRINLTNRMAEAEKLAALGQLSAGVAHEIRNPLHVILGYTQLLSMTEERKERKEKFKIIEEQIYRIERILQGISQYVRKSPPKEREKVNLNTTIQEVLSLINYRASVDNIHVNMHLTENLPEVSANKDEIHQVLLNLITNARDAMPQGGVLTITTRNKGKVVEIIFEDTGIGIPREIRDKIFDPFFTTKEAGKGTGLGLSVSRSIVERHGGTMEVENKEGRGTKFTIELPGV